VSKYHERFLRSTLTRFLRTKSHITIGLVLIIATSITTFHVHNDGDLRRAEHICISRPRPRCVAFCGFHLISASYPIIRSSSSSISRVKAVLQTLAAWSMVIVLALCKGPYTHARRAIEMC